MKLIGTIALVLLVVADNPFHSVEAQNPTREDDLNAQIALEWEAAYAYEKLATIFSRPTVGLLGFAKFFRKSSDEEIEHARKIESYMNKRSWDIKSEIIPDKYDNVYTAINTTLQLEKNVTDHLILIHKNASEDPQTQDFLDELLAEQVDSIAEQKTLLTRLEKGTTDSVLYKVIEHMIDREFS